MSEVKDEVIPEAKGSKLTRRKFLKKTGLLATGATLLGTTAFTPDKGVEEESKKETLTPWEKKKREEIASAFGFDKEKGEFRELIPFSEFEKLKIKWPPSEMSTEDLTTVNNELKEEYGFELKGGWNALLNYAVARYQEILKDPYKTIIDPTKEEVDLLIEAFSELTGLHEDFIKTIGFRENGLRGNHPAIHGDKFPASGDGMLAPCVHDGVWGKKIEEDSQLQEKEVGFFKVYGKKGFAIPIPSKVIVADQATNLAFGLAIYVEHLSQLMTNPEFKILKDFMKQKGSQLKNPQAVLMGASYTAYHHGLSPLREHLKSFEERAGKEATLEDTLYIGAITQKAIDTFSEKSWKGMIDNGQTSETKSLRFYYTSGGKIEIPESKNESVSEFLEKCQYETTNSEARADCYYFLVTHSEVQQYFLELGRKELSKYLSAEEIDRTVGGLKGMLDDLSINIADGLEQWKKAFVDFEEIKTSLKSGEAYSEELKNIRRAFSMVSMYLTAYLETWNIRIDWNPTDRAMINQVRDGYLENLSFIENYYRYRDEVWKRFKDYQQAKRKSSD